MGRSVPALLALALSGVLGAAGSRTAAAPPLSDGAVDRAGSHPAGAGYTEHRYRILGKIRLAFFWAGRDNVGSARMTWRSDGTTSALTFLAGSNPQRAPGSLNEWSYLREEVRSDRAEVFALRSLGRDEAVGGADEGAAGRSMFGVSCASFLEREVHSAQTIVDAGGATYWMFDRLLRLIAAAPHWQERRIDRPAGAVAGFLTALQQLLRPGTSDARSLKAAPPAVYVYNNAVYDLSVRNSQILGPTTVGARTFDRLARTDFAVRNRMSGEISRFAITYVSDRQGVALPVQIFYQPSFWLRVELRLDDAAEVPSDPAADGSILTRIRDICADAQR